MSAGDKSPVDVRGWKRKDIEVTKEQEVLVKFLDTIVATGGLTQYEDGTYSCAADEDWLDLADCALLAQDVLRESGIVLTVPVRSEAAESRRRTKLWALMP